MILSTLQCSKVMQVVSSDRTSTNWPHSLAGTAQRDFASCDVLGDLGTCDPLLQAVAVAKFPGTGLLELAGGLASPCLSMKAQTRSQTEMPKEP